MMTREEAIETLKENSCAMCAYGSQNMMSCDIRGCDNRDAIKALEQLPCEDAISRQAVLDMTICDGISCNECSFNTCEDGQSGCLLGERISKIPPVTPQPKTGHWKYVTDKTGHWVWECDKCGWQQRFNTKFCPDCGAKMIESQESEVEE